MCYQYGTGVVKDEVEAVKYYKMAADQGNADAQNALGEYSADMLLIGF